MASLFRQLGTQKTPLNTSVIVAASHVCCRALWPGGPDPIFTALREGPVPTRPVRFFRIDLRSEAPLLLVSIHRSMGIYDRDYMRADRDRTSRSASTRPDGGSRVSRRILTVIVTVAVIGGCAFLLTRRSHSPARSPASPLSETPLPVESKPERMNLVDLNHATRDELMRLPGVGPATADAIIAARPYADVGDLIRAKRIGPVKLAELRPLVTTTPPTNPPAKK